MKRGFGTQLWIQRPSAHWKWPLGERAPRIQLLNIGASIFSARCHTPPAQASTPCRREVSTLLAPPRNLPPRNAALTAVLAQRTHRDWASGRPEKAAQSAARLHQSSGISSSANGRAGRPCVDRPFGPTSLFPVQAGAGRDERVVRGDRCGCCFVRRRLSNSRSGGD